MEQRLMYSFVVVTLLWGVPDTQAQSETSNNSHMKTHQLVTAETGEIDLLLEEIRQATAIFKDPKMAQTSGYRPLGPDMPNMGVHWIHPGLAINRIFDLTQPSTLTYLDINGELTLTGVAYTFPVRPGETPPDLPVEQMHWHHHSGNLEEEAHGLHQIPMEHSREEQVSLAMVHAWVWSKNPDGVFVPDNWALSYLRLGLEPPHDPQEDASKALFLINGGIEYFVRFVELSAGIERIDTTKVREIMDFYAEKVDAIADVIKKRNSVTEQDQNSLKRIWQEMWNQIELTVGSSVWPSVARHL